MKETVQGQRLYDLIVAAIESLPAQHSKDRVAEIAGEMFEKYAGEIEFFSAISVICRAGRLAPFKKEADSIDTLAVMQ